MPIVSARMTQDEHETGEDGEYKSYGTQLALHVSRIGLILVSLVWGVFLLINAIPTIGQKEAITKLGAQRLNTIASDGLLKVSFPSVRNGTFQPIFQSIHWVSGREHAANDNGLFVTFTNDAYFVKSVYDESFYKVLHKGKAFTFEGNSYVIDLYQASPSLTSALVRTNTVKNWRHSTFGSYFIISTVTGEVQHIGDNISVALWSPNSDKVAFVHDNDLYLYYVETANVERISHDGSDIIFNGRTDWVYEEEIYENDIATWWSPSGMHIAYLKINEDKVHEYPLTYFVQEEEKPYPEVRRIRYPKSGTPNPLVSLNIYDVSTGRLSVVDFSDNSFIVTEVKWVGEREVLAKMTDRTSDRLSVVMASAENDVVSTPRIELSEDGWWEVTHNTLYIPKSIAAGRADDGYIDVVTSEGYNHLGYFSPPSNSTATLLTQGEWEVVDGALAFDAVTDRVYFFATKKDTTERHLYYVTLSEPLKVVEVTDTSTPGVYSASFSGGSRFILLSYNGPDIPYQKLIDLRSTQGDDEVHGNVIGETLYYLQENTKLKKNLEKYSISRPSFRELDLGTDERGQDIIVNSYEILPPDFNPSLQNHYPVFFYAYGGPNSQLVQKRFGVGFFHVIAAELDAIVVVVDGRGTGLKGKDFRSVVRGNLGDLEAEDQIRAARIYRSKSFVNKDKISIFGWSYGGYLTLKTLEKDAGATFKYGMAVAPVTDWRLYDTIYTERYMLTPQINPQGYAKSKVHNATALAQAKRFLLMHGTGDDNVHFQHSLRLLDMLNLAGVENYDVHVFPDSDHSIRYHNADVIIYDRLLSWARQAFDGNFVRHLY